MNARIIIAAVGASVAVGAAAATALATGGGTQTGQLMAASVAPASASAPSPSASPASTKGACDDGAWIGADNLRVEGRPDNLDAGDRGATYVWHDNDGWHIRSTDPSGQQAHYTGVIHLTAGATFHDVTTVKLEKDDHVRITDGGRTLAYSFDTFSGIDGVDFHVSACANDRTHEAITFSMRRNGSDDDASRIDVGDQKQHPDSSTWRAHRTV